MTNKMILICFIAIFLSGMRISPAFTETLVDFASSPNPVGSGARAIGMGGAFIGIADDATAGSWNSGGLAQLETHECSIVGNYTHLIEDIFPFSSLGASGKQTVDNKELNFFSLSSRFKFLERFLVLSLNYQQLYNFNKEWDFPITMKMNQGSRLVDFSGEQSFIQDGSLSALGLAWAVQWNSNLSFGATLNVWDDDICNNKWSEKNTLQDCGYFTNMFGEDIFFEFEDIAVRDEYTFDGINFNLGLLYRMEPLTIGLVYKSPFKADINHTHFEENKYTYSEEHLKMPASYGIGMSYRFSSRFRISADIYHTQWQKYISIDENGKESSPVTKKSVNQSDVDPTTQIRMGAEYLWIDESNYAIVPFRMGLFYDPAPSDGSPDTYWGFSLGSGYKKGNVQFDIAYQARFGNDVGGAIIPDYDFKMDVEEHQVFCSFIFYLTKDEKEL